MRIKFNIFCLFIIFLPLQSSLSVINNIAPNTYFFDFWYDTSYFSHPNDIDKFRLYVGTDINNLTNYCEVFNHHHSQIIHAGPIDHWVASFYKYVYPENSVFINDSVSIRIYVNDTNTPLYCRTSWIYDRPYGGSNFESPRSGIFTVPLSAYQINQTNIILYPPTNLRSL